MKERLPETSLKGQFLLAMPGMGDPNFSRTVTCLCEHTPNGAVGIVINRVHPTLKGKDIFEELGMEFSPESGSIPIFLGGPVHMGEVFILHGPPLEWEGSLIVTPELALTNTVDILRAISKGVGPESIMIALGCAGWGPNQLESELMSNAWLTHPASHDIIFDVMSNQRWETTLKKMGIDPTFLTDSAGHA